nr:MAG TPA: hypothetical protein [Caudoviricetes sp.]
MLYSINHTSFLFLNHYSLKYAICQTEKVYFYY